MSLHIQFLIDKPQEILDRLYMQNGPRCAGCDWWHYYNSLAGECRKSAPVSGVQRVAMLGAYGSSLSPEAGHIMTLRDHHCGDFVDTFDWSTLPQSYLRRIGRDTP